MNIDPVCGMEVYGKHEFEYNGKTYYFCSKKCVKRFSENPELFLSTIELRNPSKCIACGNQIKDGLLMKGKGPYCCERCYFRDRLLGDVIDKIEGIYLSIMESFIEAIDAREHEVKSHSIRVSQLSVILAKQIGVWGRDLIDIYCGALLHDIGKIGISDEILLKNTKLSREEQLRMQEHPEIGHRILCHIDYLVRAAEIVLSHHEHYDGSGYPRGLEREEIPLGARIFTVCDTLDAITVDRHYREAITFDQAMDYILFESGVLFDPGIVNMLYISENDMREFVEDPIS
jgi:putative nucleotidyltransferase with HDIG domain